MDSSVSALKESAEEYTPLALQEPTQPRGLGWQLLYWGANASIGVGNIVFYTLLLPYKIALLSPAGQTSAFIVLSGIGAVASILTNPLIGALSDRTTSQLGRRFPWLLVGMIVLLVAMLALASATSLLVLGIGSVLLQIAINMLLAALSALLPDQVPLRQRATVGAWGGMAPLVGGLLGQVLVGQVFRDINTAFLDLALLAVILLLAFCCVLRETPLPKASAEPFHLRDVPRSLWLSPRRYPEFALVWWARVLIFLVSTTVINYLFYYLQDMHLFSLATATTGVQQFFTIYVVTILLASLLCGKMSDVLQHRKPFVLAGSMLMAGGVALLAFVPLWPLVLVASGILGTGFGMYLACDLALASQLLPSAARRGKDFGIMNMAIFLPMLAATGIAEIALNQLHSFPVLLCVLLCSALVAAGLIVPVRSVA